MYETRTTVSQTAANQSAMWCHLSALLFCWLPFGFILAPVLVWMQKRDESPFVRQQGKEAINFNLTMMLVWIIVAVGFFLAVWNTLPTDVLLGQEVSFSELPENVKNWMLGGLGLFALWALMIALAAVSAKNGKNFKYPIRIPFLR